MEFIGEILKKTRIEKKYSFSKIVKELNINSDILHNIENNEINVKSLDSVYLVGHIRAYAKYLDLDHDRIVENFKIQTSYNNKELNSEISKPINNKNIILFPKAISFVSIIAVASSFYFLFISPSGDNNNYAITPDLPENLSFDLEEIEMNLSLNNYNSDINQKKLSDEQLFQKEEQIFLPNFSSATASIPSDSLMAGDKQITLKFLNTTWIQLRDTSDNIILSKLMNQGDEYSYSVSKKLLLTAGNAGNIIIVLDGVIKGKAGKAGEVIDSLIVENKYTK